MTVRIGITIGDATSVAVCRTDGEDDPTIFTSATVLAIDTDGTVLFADDVDVPAMRSPRFATDFVGAIPHSDGFPLADGQSVRPEDLMARAAWCMVESVHAMSDDDDRVLVVTHPARWSRNSRNRLRDGLDHVGLPEARLVSEADAAVNQLRAESARQPATAVVTADLDVVDIAIIGPRAEASLGPSPTIGVAASTRPARGVTLRSAYFRGPEVVADLWRDVIDRAGVVPRRLVLTGVRGEDPTLAQVCADISGLTPQIRPHLAARGAYVIANRLVAATDAAMPPPSEPEPEPEPPATTEDTVRRSRRLLDRTPVVSGVTMLGLAAIAVGAMSTSPSWSGQDRTGRESDFPMVSSSVVFMPTQDAVEMAPPAGDSTDPGQGPTDTGVVVPPATAELYVPPVVTTTPQPTSAESSRSDGGHGNSGHGTTNSQGGTPSRETTPTGPWTGFPSLPLLPTGITSTAPSTSRTTSPGFGTSVEPTRSGGSTAQTAEDDTKESETPRTERNSTD